MLFGLVVLSGLGLSQLDVMQAYFVLLVLSFAHFLQSWLREGKKFFVPKRLIRLILVLAVSLGLWFVLEKKTFIQLTLAAFAWHVVMDEAMMRAVSSSRSFLLASGLAIISFVILAIAHVGSPLPLSAWWGGIFVLQILTWLKFKEERTYQATWIMILLAFLLAIHFDSQKVQILTLALLTGHYLKWWVYGGLRLTGLKPRIFFAIESVLAISFFALTTARPLTGLGSWYQVDYGSLLFLFSLIHILDKVRIEDLGRFRQASLV